MRADPSGGRRGPPGAALHLAGLLLPGRGAGGGRSGSRTLGWAAGQLGHLSLAPCSPGRGGALGTVSGPGQFSPENVVTSLFPRSHPTGRESWECPGSLIFLVWIKAKKQ